MTTTSPFQPGTRVKHGHSTLMRAHDYWLNSGRQPMKEGARVDYEAKLAARGTIIETDTRYISGGQGVSVLWDSGQTSHCLPHCVQLA